MKNEGIVVGIKTIRITLPSLSKPLGPVEAFLFDWV